MKFPDPSFQFPVFSFEFSVSSSYWELVTGNWKLCFHVLQQTSDDLIRVDAVRFRLEVHQQSMPQHRECDRADVLMGHDAAAFEERPRLGAEEQRLPCPGARTPADPLVDPLGYFFGGRLRGPRRPARARIPGPRGANLTRRVVHDVLGGRDLPDERVHVLDLAARR